MTAIQRVCITVLVMLFCVEASWMSAARKLFRKRSAARDPRVINEIEELKQKLAFMYEENAGLKRMVRNSKQLIQMFRKEMEAHQRAHRLELEAMGDQYVANEDELRNDLLSASEEEMRSVVKDLQTRNELEMQQLTANMTNAHDKELASLRTMLKQHETTISENDRTIRNLKSELLESSKRHNLQHDHEDKLHKQELSALREELSQQRASQSPQVKEESVSITGDHTVAAQTATQPEDIVLSTEPGIKRSTPRGSRRPARKHSADTGGDGYGNSNSQTGLGLKSSRVSARGNSLGGR